MLATRTLCGTSGRGPFFRANQGRLAKGLKRKSSCWQDKVHRKLSKNCADWVSAAPFFLSQGACFLQIFSKVFLLVSVDLPTCSRLHFPIKNRHLLKQTRWFTRWNHGSRKDQMPSSFRRFGSTPGLWTSPGGLRYFKIFEFCSRCIVKLSGWQVINLSWTSPNCILLRRGCDSGYLRFF